MSNAEPPRSPPLPSLELVPRYEDQGYGAEHVAARRRWVEAKTGAVLTNVGAFSTASEEMRGNVENPIGAAQVPLGVAGPLLVHGEHAEGEVWVPLATTEGALVRSYERGMVALHRAGGARACLWRDENRVCPVFVLADVATAHRFAGEVEAALPELQAAAAATTRHGRLLRLACHPVGREVIVELAFATGDAHGMNMIVRAADAVCAWIGAHLGASHHLLFSGYEGEKRAAGAMLAGGKGKTVVADARLRAPVVRSVLGTTPAALAELWQRTVHGHLASAALGYNGHLANGLTALFIACGQDVANVVNAAVGITVFEVVEEGDLYASVTLPALTVATVGGGTAYGTAAECLAMLGCRGDGKAGRLAEIAAATALAGELSFGAAVASGGFVAAHETYGRNRPRSGPSAESGSTEAK